MGDPRRLMPLVITGVLLVLAGLFVMRVVVLYNRIQDGQGKTPFDEVSELTRSPRLAAAIRSTPEDKVYDVVDEKDPTLGSDKASLTIVEFADFGCPYSRKASFSLRALALAYGEKIRYIYRDFPIAEIHPEAFLAAQAGECANEQNGFWAYHDMLYQNQDDLSRNSLRAYAQAVGLDLGAFDRCLASGRYRQEVEDDYAAGVAAGVVGTPTFFFNGRRVEGAIPLEVLRTLVDTFLNL
jgi:protein-disulfide isomerase